MTAEDISRNVAQRVLYAAALAVYARQSVAGVKPLPPLGIIRRFCQLTGKLRWAAICNIPSCERAKFHIR